MAVLELLLSGVVGRQDKIDQALCQQICWSQMAEQLPDFGQLLKNEASSVQRKEQLKRSRSLQKVMAIMARYTCYAMDCAHVCERQACEA